MTESIDLDNFSTHSLNCGSDYKEVHCVQQQNIGKLSRNDLEDSYYQLHDENIEIKKKFNSLDNKYKIMATKVMRLSRDHKCIDSLNREEDQRQLQQLKQSEAAMRAKLTVLRGQLASHTRLHSAALSKVQRPKSHRCSRSCHASRSGCGGDDDSLLETSRSRSQGRGQARHLSASRGGSLHGTQLGGGTSSSQKELSEMSKVNEGLHDEVAHLQEKINILQKDLQHSNELSRIRIQELETELGKHLTEETAENVELIKARRIIKQHEVSIISLQQEHQLMQRELQACKAALSLAARDQDELCSTLMRERQRGTDLQQEIVKLTQNCSSMREIEEQLNDAKKENAVLKEHSNRLLQLSTSNADARNSPRVDLKNKQQFTSNAGNHDVSTLSDENSAMERKLENLKEQQSKLKQELKEAEIGLSTLRKKIQDAKDERNNLSDEHVKVQNECSKLLIELAEPREERKRLTQQLTDLRNECAHLAEGLSQTRTDLEEHRREQHNFHYETSDRKASLSFPERSGYNRAEQQLGSPRATATNHTHFFTPQLPSRSDHFATVQSRSHPSTPRPRPCPRFGDACLALLEQTAIRSPSSSFPAVLSSHGSLQERFLELCTQPTPAPPNNDRDTPSKGSGVAENMSGDPVQSPCLGTRQQQQSGLNDTQRELDKCRELLRVQFNLNSIYKKEVASLNNIVQSLTSVNQEAIK